MPASMTEDKVVVTDVRVPSEIIPSAFDALAMKAVSSIADSCACRVSCAGTLVTKDTVTALNST